MALFTKRNTLTPEILFRFENRSVARPMSCIFRRQRQRDDPFEAVQLAFFRQGA